MASTGLLLLHNYEWRSEQGSLKAYAVSVGEEAPYGWRLVLMGSSYDSLDTVRAKPSEGWRSDYYSQMDTAEFSEKFQVSRSKQRDKRPEVFAVVGSDTAYEKMFVEGKARSALPSASILLIDANLPCSHWMEPVEVRAGLCESGLPEPATMYGRAVFFVGGDAWLLAPRTPDDAICKFMTVESAEKWSREEVLGKYLIARIPFDSEKPLEIGRIEWVRDSDRDPG